MSFDVDRFVCDARELATRNIKFLHQGSNPETGLDCVHVARFLYCSQGLTLPDEFEREFDSYHPYTDGARMFEVMRHYLIQIPPQEAKCGDLLLFRGKQSTRHLAIKVTDDEPPNIVEAHRSDSADKLIEWPLDSLRARLVVAAFRIPREII